MERIESNTF
uniref:Uncharacterized protein n=1 Tax=Anguilla anguilla TaxID=7936 RepID=A0A0E9TKF3_ANGAN